MDTVQLQNSSQGSHGSSTKRMQPTCPEEKDAGQQAEPSVGRRQGRDREGGKAGVAARHQEDVYPPFALDSRMVVCNGKSESR